MDISLEGVSFSVQDRPVLQSLSVTISGGALTCLVGPNGAGKTTLLRILCGEMKLTSGRLRLGDSDASSLSLSETARRFALIPQGIGDPPYLTVRELVALGRFRPERRLRLRLDPADEQAVSNCIHQCGLEKLAERPVAQLSGGEKQRAWAAFALAQDKEFLVLDEALDALDMAARRDFFQLLQSVVARGKGVLLTTHDVGLALEFANRVIVLDCGRLVYEGPPSSALLQMLTTRTAV